MTGLDVVVVGAGSAGLGVGYHLRQAGLEFVILERGEIGESWRSQRWDSFALNTPNHINGLPGSPYDGKDPDGFMLRDEVVNLFERHAQQHSLPIRTGTTVERVSEKDGQFVVEAVDADRQSIELTAPNVIVASGGQRVPRIPAISGGFPDSILQIHAADYRSPDRLPEGAVVVVGSAQSGCQITEDLLEGGRTVYLCTSRVARVPRRYRGHDTLHWFLEAGLLDQTVDDLEDPMMQFAAQPQVSGVGPQGRTVSLQGLHRQGCHLMGRLREVADGILMTDDSLAEHIKFADEFSAELKSDIDALIAVRGIDTLPEELDPIDAPAGPDVAASGLTKVDLETAGVSTVVWCTGFGGDFGWLQVPVFDDDGHPIHERGITLVPGVYFLGLPWLHTRKSGILAGIDGDAGWVVGAIATRMAEIGRA